MKNSWTEMIRLSHYSEGMPRYVQPLHIEAVTFNYKFSVQMVGHIMYVSSESNIYLNLILENHQFLLLKSLWLLFVAR